MAAKKNSNIKGSVSSFKFQSTSLDSLFGVLDAIAWLDSPNVKQIAQFAGVDPRTVGKVLKNGLTIGLVDTITEADFTLRLAYPYKGSLEQKEAVIREALVRMPLLTSIRQFLKLGDNMEDALRKGATVSGIENFESSALAPLIKWVPIPIKMDTVSDSNWTAWSMRLLVG